MAEVANGTIDVQSIETGEEWTEHVAVNECDLIAGRTVEDAARLKVRTANDMNVEVVGVRVE